MVSSAPRNLETAEGARQAQGSFHRFRRQRPRTSSTMRWPTPCPRTCDIREKGDPVMNHRHHTAYYGTIFEFSKREAKTPKGDTYHQRSPHGRVTVHRARPKPQQTLVGGAAPQISPNETMRSNDKQSKEFSWRLERNVVAGARGSGRNGRVNTCAVPSTTDGYNILSTYRRP